MRWPSIFRFSAVLFAVQAGAAQTLGNEAGDQAKLFLDSVLLKSPYYGRDLETERPGLGGPRSGILPVYCPNARRQTDSMLRQAYRLLPEEIRKQTVFIHVPRFLTAPDRYTDDLAGKKSAVLIGSFMGIGRGESEWSRERHREQLHMLKMTVRYIQLLGLPIKDVYYAMGDSSAKNALDVRRRLQKQAEKTAGVRVKTSWGADETVLTAFADQLPRVAIDLKVSNPDAPQWYEGQRPAREIIQEKLPSIGVTVGPNPAFTVAVFTRRKGGANNDFEPDDDKQRQLDRAFLQSLNTLARAKVALVDGRLFNGAWDSRLIDGNTDWLAYGSWGTFGNCFGATVAMAKLLHFNMSEHVRRQLFLEAIAHDVFANGYEEMQRGPGKREIEKTGVRYNHWAGYKTAQETAKVFGALNKFVNQRMKMVFGTAMDRKVRFTPQLWRTFESEVHLVPRREEDLFEPGMYRTDLPRETFDPTYRVDKS